MTHKTFVIGLALTALLGTVACESQRDYREPGRYEKKSSYVDEYGTTYENRDTTEITTDRHGRRHKSVESKTTKDPKGLFNKKTTHEYHEEADPQ